MEIFFLFGPPGSGKGTQKKLTEKYLEEKKKSFFSIEVGELLRNYVQEDSVSKKRLAKIMGEGRMVPVAISVLVTLKEFMAIDKETEYVIIDGSSRRVAEARLLFEVLVNLCPKAKLHALELEVTEEEVQKRLQLRGRPDDIEESIKNRLRIYYDKERGTKASMAYIEKQYPIEVHTIDGIGSRDAVHKRIRGVMNI